MLHHQLPRPAVLCYKEIRCSVEKAKCSAIYPFLSQAPTASSNLPEEETVFPFLPQAPVVYPVLPEPSATRRLSTAVTQQMFPTHACRSCRRPAFILDQSFPFRYHRLPVSILVTSNIP